MSVLRKLTTKTPHLPAIIVLGISLLIFWPTMLKFFAIDDFYWLWLAMHSLSHFSGWIHAFTHINGSGQYRPLSLQVFFWIGLHLFSLNPLGFHLLDMSAFLYTGWLCYRLALRLVPSPLTAACATAAFLFSAIHFEHLVWVDAFTETSAALLVVAALLATVLGRDKYAVVWYVLGLASNETTIILPVLVLVYFVIYERLPLWSAMKRGWRLWATLIVYSILRVTVLGGIQARGAFATVWSPSVWIREIIHSGLTVIGLNPPMRNVWTSGAPWSWLVGIALTVLIVLIVSVIVYDKGHGIRWRLMAVGFAWFLIGLLPVLPFAHNFADYTISIPAIGVPLILLGLLGANFQRLAYPLVAASLLALSICDMYGPGGLYQVDGNVLLANGDHAAFLQMQAVESQVHRPLIVSIVGPPQARTALGGQWTAMVVADGSKTVLGRTPNADLSLRFNPITLTFTVVGRSTTP